MIEIITANHFKYDGKLYYAPTKAIESYAKRKTLRNLLSRARLLNNDEASSVTAALGRVLVLACDGKIVVKVVKSPRAEVISQRRVHRSILILFRSEKVNMRAASKLIHELAPQDLPKHFKAAYITDGYIDLVN